MSTSSYPPVGYNFSKPGYVLINFRYVCQNQGSVYDLFSKNPGFISRPVDQLIKRSLLIILTFFICIRHRLFLWIPAGEIFIFFKMAIRALGPTQLLIQWRAEFIALVVQLSKPEAAHSPPSNSEVNSECRDICTFLSANGNIFTFSRFDSECSWYSSVFPCMLYNLISYQTTTTSCYILSYSWPPTLSKLQSVLY
jgi:hypothetical protein